MCTLEKLTHTQTASPPEADLSSSCSFLPATLKPVHVCQCPSLWTPLSPSLPFCYISCVSASLPTFSAWFLFFPLPTQCSESLIKCFIMSLNKVKCSISLFLPCFPRFCCITEVSFTSCLLHATSLKPRTLPYFSIFLLLLAAFLSWLDTCGDWTVYLLWYPWSLWSLLLLSLERCFRLGCTLE